MPQCPRCQKWRRVKETVKVDRKSRKRYFISSCIKCGWNFDSEEITKRGTGLEEDD